MEELSVEEFKKVKFFYSSQVIGGLLLASVFKGNYPGRVFVNNKEKPTSALVYAGACYLGGNISDVIFNKQVKTLLVNEFLPKAEGGPLFIISTSDECRSMLDELLFDIEVNKFKRLKYELSPERFKKHTNWKTHIPEGYEIRKIDQSILKSLPGYALEYWDSSDQFLQEGFGYVVLKGKKLISTCWTFLLDRQVAELAVETNENYRRQGFATLACCACIDHCLENHLRIEWDCFELPPTMNLAEKLGFVKKAEIDVHILM